MEKVRPVILIICDYYLPGFESGGAMRTLVNMITIGVAMFYNSVKRFRSGDKVLVVTAPPTMPVTTAFAALLRGASYTVLVQDSYPEILIAVGSLKENSIATGIVNFFNRWVYKYASKIIVMGRDMATVEMEGSFDARTRVFYQMRSFFHRLMPSYRRVTHTIAQQWK